MKALTLAMFIFFILADAQAFCLPRSAPQVDSANDYSLALVDSLAMLRTARDRSNDLKKAGAPMELIAILKTAAQDYECAASYAAPYRNSKNEAVGISAKGIAAAAA